MVSAWIRRTLVGIVRSKLRALGRGEPGADLPLVTAHRLVGHLGVVAAAHEQSEGTLSAPIVHESDRHSRAEHGAGGVELRLGAATGEHLLHELGSDPPALQRSGDPILAPAVESPPILDETAREAGVVEISGARDLGQRRIGGGRLDSPPLE